jgi:hypothetical protein
MRDEPLPGTGAPAGSRGVAVWSSPRWQALALEWVDERLAETGAHRTGDVTARIRAWAAVLRVPSTRGVVWLKAASHETGAEVALYALLTAVVPDRVLTPIAADVSRGWILLPDGGTSLADSLGDTHVVTLLERILPQYAQLQLELAPRASELIELGLADMSPARALERFDQAAAVVRDAVGPHDEARYTRALAHRDAFASWAHRLAKSPVPLSIDHNDLHAANVLLPHADLAVPARFYDWGDSVVAHPFATMLHGLGWVAASWGTHDRDPRILRLQNAYLGPFAHYGPLPELTESLELACRVAKAARCLSWARAIELGDEARGFESAPLDLFASIPDDSYLSPI